MSYANFHDRFLSGLPHDCELRIAGNPAKFVFGCLLPQLIADDGLSGEHSVPVQNLTVGDFLRFCNCLLSNRASVQFWRNFAIQNNQKSFSVDIGLGSKPSAKIGKDFSGRLKMFRAQSSISFRMGSLSNLAVGYQKRATTGFSRHDSHRQPSDAHGHGPCRSPPTPRTSARSPPPAAPDRAP